MTKADKEFLKQWLKALRSGKYKQGDSWLHYKNRGKDYYCCLGVACVLADPSSKWEPYDEDSIKSGVTVKVMASKTGSTVVLPYDVMARLGFRNSQGLFGKDAAFLERLAKKNKRVFKKLEEFTNDGKHLSIVNLNDSKRFSFVDIADIVECDPPDLFVKEN